jgi:LmbE family N-acetylglucosaminyl deacetylase
MPDALKLMCIFAHPDDETLLGTGGLLAKYAAEGVETYLISATRGERGWQGDPDQDPGLEGMGRLREAELREAASILGLHEVNFLDYIDGELDQVNPEAAIATIVSHLRRVQPQVVITFPPDGIYGHPDHIAISQLVSAAVVCAATATYGDPCSQSPHCVAKLYYTVSTKALVELFEPFGDLISVPVDGIVRKHLAWEDWAVTTRLNTEAYWQTVLKALSCYRSQLMHFPPPNVLPEEFHRNAWGWPTLYRVFSKVNGGRMIETDIFEGLR